jgi:thiamine pyrophosphate-dependent acetolactate synthase large subunit-like protein
VKAVDVARAALAAEPDALFVASLGTATSALRAASDDGPHLYFGGAMACALPAALGVAESAPGRRVVVLLGDGELLMGASALWSLAALAPANLLAVVLLDSAYSITGGQPLGTPTRFCEVARSLGVAAERAESPAELQAAAARLPRPALVEAVVSEVEWPGPSPFVDPPLVRHRFEQAVSR